MAKKTAVKPATVAKWAAGAGVAGTAGYLLVTFLLASGLVSVVDHSGDSYCKGTIEDPCKAVVTLQALKDFTIDKGDWQFSSTPKLKQVGLVVNGIDPAKKAVSIKKGQNFTVEIFAYKNSPSDSVKWTLGPLDPIFYPAASIEWRQPYYNITVLQNVSWWVDNCSWVPENSSWVGCENSTLVNVTEQVSNGSAYQVIFNPVKAYRIGADQFGWDDEVNKHIIVVDKNRCDAEAKRPLSDIRGCAAWYVQYNYTTEGDINLQRYGDSDYVLASLEEIV